MLSAAFSAGPELYSLLLEAAKNGTIEEKILEKEGVDAILADSEGFTEGSVSSAILLACREGKGLSREQPGLGHQEDRRLWPHSSLP